MAGNSVPSLDWEASSFRLVAESVRDFISVVDTDGQRLYSSPSLRALYGENTDLAGSSSFADIHPDDRERVREIFRETVNTGVGKRASYRFVLKDGSTHYVESESSVVRDADGKVANIVIISRDITDRKTAENKLAESRQRLDMALATGNVAIFEWNIALDSVYLSDQWNLLMGGSLAPTMTTSREFIKRVHPGDSSGFRKRRAKALKGEPQDSAETYYYADFRYGTPSGEWKWLEARGRIVERSPDGRALRMLGTFTDITAHKEAEEKVHRLSNLYATLSQTNQAIVRIRDRETLFPQICRCAVEYGRFRMAWIGLIDAEKNELTYAASAGEDQAFLSTLPWPLQAEHPMAGRPAATAAREGRPYICNDLLGDPNTLPWRDAIALAGFRATASFPIRQADRVIGIFGLYATEENFFSDDLIRLLDEMAIDISFALDNYAREAERQAADAALQESELRKTAMLQAALDCIITADEQGRIVDFNPAAEKTFGYRREEVVGKTLAETIIPPALREAHESGMAHYQRTGEGPVLGKRIEITAMRADGSEFPVELAITPIVSQGRHLFTAYLRDITERKRAQELLHESENRYRKLVESSPEAIFVHQAGKFQLVNGACVELLRAPGAAALIGKPVLDVVHPDYHAIVIERARRIFREKVAVPFLEEKWVRLDGSVFDAEIAAKPFLIDGEHATQVVIRDISERKQMERLLQRLAEGTNYAEPDKFFPTFVQQLAFALGMKYAAIAEIPNYQSPRAKILAYWKESTWASGFEYDIEHTPCQTVLLDNGVCCYPSDVQSLFPRDKALVELNVESYAGAVLLDASGKTIGHVFVMDDEPIHNEARVKAILKIFASRAAAELERMRAEQNMRHMAHHDLLTGLPNRVLLQDRIEQALAHADRNAVGVAILFLDLDRFKNINDTLGHAAGDRGLQEIAGRLRGVLRTSDTVARVGGDEFTVIIDDMVDPRVVGDTAQRILDVVARPVVLDGQECQLTASIGIATYPGDARDVPTLLKNADIAMYRAKGVGKNNYQFYSAQMNVHTVERLTLESQLRKAVHQGEFVLHYQPMVSVSTGEIVGAEALVRWQHPDFGLIGPGRFIPIAEETGLISQLGLWVLKAACAEARCWHDAGHQGTRIAVNLSALQFVNKDLPRDIVRILQETRLDPRNLELEITESAVMQNPTQAEMQLKQLKDLGISVSIDDFGTGYSSLTYLKRFPIDCIKIDSSFIRGIPGDTNDAAITRAVITLGQSLKMTVVAEGVEKRGQVDFLKAHGCDEIQGFVFSPPVPADQFQALLRDAPKYLL